MGLRRPVNLSRVSPITTSLRAIPTKEIMNGDSNKMNGDSKKIYDAILDLNKEMVEIRTRQEERHLYNVEKLKILDNLPCEKRAVMYDAVADHMEQGKKWRIAIIGVVVAIVIQVFSFSNGYGALTTKVNMLDKGFTEHIESYNLLIKKYLHGKKDVGKN